MLRCKIDLVGVSLWESWAALLLVPVKIYWSYGFR